MAERWSNPSFGQGDQRFYVWPLGTDSYTHAHLAANWDKADAIFGGPSSGEWPVGGIHGEIQRASDGAIPLGMIFPWYRPSLAVSLPTGYVVVDGSTLNSTQHDFPGGGDVTIPDLRNRFVLGADPEKAIGTAGSSVGSLLAHDVDGAPGPQGVGGANAVTLEADQLPKHSHAGSLTGWSPTVMVWYFQASTYAAQQNAPRYLDNRDEAIEKCGYPGCYYDPERTAPIYPASGNFTDDRWGTGVNHSTGQGGWKSGQHRHTITSLSTEGGGLGHENRPRYIGLIWLMKVKNSG